MPHTRVPDIGIGPALARSPNTGVDGTSRPVANPNEGVMTSAQSTGPPRMVSRVRRFDVRVQEHTN